ncbi:MSMEG_4193 family putative phosphomutase [Phototrophicus methaneseepsis]|uniref:MSMEG_4193 family putative phosphomutase n=1 Tax=Phototrophicus methaneseepsis TaxID=2710758 RepID=A0A7S8E919_9CHLR|nr:MSMEG_4193 family putative phosphomutase [Phototrophicus methaneseepsis]QPC82595.1 MSMEG_4193 family putative phosphomutase [Phototrophicus methaneseepsis]
MTQLLLIRHAVNDFVKTGKLAGWTPGVHLNEEGQAQAAALGERLASVKLSHIYASPLERTMETAQAIVEHHPHLEVEQHLGIGEVRYGDWEGKKIADLRSRKMWQVVQEYPSRAYFPGGEAMRDVQSRVVNALESIVDKHPGQTVALVFHADLIKMAVAHYLGVHLDNFQRIVISPASITTIMLGHSRPYVATVNDTAHVQAMKKQKEQAKNGENRN